MSYLTRLRTTPAVGCRSRARSQTARGGFAWALDDWARLRRFLVLGSEGGSYYAGERQLTRENAEAVARCIEADGRAHRRGDRRDQRRGPCAEERSGRVRARDGGRRRRRGDTPRGARGPAARVPHEHAPVPVRVVRRGLPRLGPRPAPRGRRLVRGAPGRRARLPGGEVPRAGGRDAPRRAAPRAPGGSRERRQPDARRDRRAAPPVRVDRPRRRDRRTAARRRGLRARPGGRVAGAVRPSSSGSTACRARRSAASTSTEAVVWEALLEDMPMTALVRNLATMTRVGVLAPGSSGTAQAVAQLGDRERIRKARVHPIALLSALRTYAEGHGVRGKLTWTPVAGDRRRARRRVLHGVRERRADRQAAPARARRVGLDGGRRGRRRAGPDAARRDRRRWRS